MKKGIILYQSKYGATKKYADWLAKDTNFDCIETSKAKVKNLEEYETIVLCGGIYASHIGGLRFLRKNYGNLKGKKIAVFCVGASPYDEKAFHELKNQNFKDDFPNIPLFYGRGAWDEEKMTWKDRFLCTMLQKSVAKKDPSTFEPWMKALMEAIGKKCDWTDPKYLKPLFDYLA